MEYTFNRLIREPLVQFLVIGALIYGAYALFGEPPPAEQDRRIVITEAQVTSLANGFARRWQRPPTDEELLGLVRDYVRETLLYREALAMGLDEEDHIVRRRLAQKLEFLTNDLVRLDEPGDDELEAFLRENMDQFRPSDLLTFSHVFLDPDMRGDATLADAETLLAELNEAGEPTQELLRSGDRFMMQSYFPEASYREIQRQMGSGFADQVMRLEPGRWHGPVLSGYGVHLVWVSSMIRAQEPELADVREDVLNEYYRRQTEAFNAEYLDALMERYEVIMDDPSETAPASPDETGEASS
jgi:hypothetical protein